MSLLRDVVLKGQPRRFDEYCATVRSEEEGALAWLAGGGDWSVPEGLRAKVGVDGRFLPFIGDTVVVPVEPLTDLQNQLHQAVPQFLAERLDPAEFHVTVHDLLAGPAATADRMEENRARCQSILDGLRGQVETIRLAPLRVYPSVNVSVVAGYVPETDRDFRILMNAYNLFDDVVYLPHWLRPHVTLGYFVPRPPDVVERARLWQTIHEMRPPALTLDLRRMCYQRFTDMNHYATL